MSLSTRVQDLATRIGNYFRDQYVFHGSTASTARPSVTTPVIWVGSVEPTNMANGDIFFNTSV